MKRYSLEEVVNLTQGTIELGSSKRLPLYLQSVADIRRSGPNQLSFIAQKKYEAMAHETKAGVLMVEHSFKPKAPLPCPLLRVENVYMSLCFFLEALEADITSPKTGTEEPVHIGNNCQLGKDIYIGAFAYIGNNVRIGDNVQIYPQSYIGDNVQVGDMTTLHSGVRLYEGTQIGRSCVIHSGAVLGSPGFGYVPTAEGHYRYIPQIGKVIIEDDVHIGANTAIDRATFDKTLIETGVRLDNLIQVGHNAQIGKHSVMAAQVGVAGSAKVGNHCLVSGQIGIEQNTELPEHTRFGMRGSAFQGVKKTHQTIIGNGVITLKEYASFLQLIKRVNKIEEQLNSNNKS